jgi:hypothetical protein
VQCGRERAREVIVVGFVLLIAGAHAALLREARAEAARSALLRLRGDYAVAAPAAGGEVELALKSGFVALLRRPRPGSHAPVVLSSGARSGATELRVAKVRAASAEIDPTFVPIGPTVELAAGAGRAELSFVADHFRVRRGQRLVLAVEQPCTGPDGSRCSRWRLEPARHERGRCVAQGIEPTGLRLQFGSLQ